MRITFPLPEDFTGTPDITAYVAAGAPVLGSTNPATPPIGCLREVRAEPGYVTGDLVPAPEFAARIAAETERMRSAVYDDGGAVVPGWGEFDTIMALKKGAAVQVDRCTTPALTGGQRTQESPPVLVYVSMWWAVADPAG